MTTRPGAATPSRSAANRALLAQALSDSARNVENREYLELRRRVAEKGLLNRQYGYYAISILAALAALALGVGRCGHRPARSTVGPIDGGGLHGGSVHAVQFHRA